VWFAEEKGRLFGSAQTLSGFAGARAKERVARARRFISVVAG